MVSAVAKSLSDRARCRSSRSASIVEAPSPRGGTPSLSASAVKPGRDVVQTHSSRAGEQPEDTTYLEEGRNLRGCVRTVIEQAVALTDQIEEHPHRLGGGEVVIHRRDEPLHRLGVWSRLGGDFDSLLEPPQPIQRRFGVLEEVGGVLELSSGSGPSGRAAAAQWGPPGRAESPGRPPARSTSPSSPHPGSPCRCVANIERIGCPMPPPTGRSRSRGGGR